MLLSLVYFWNFINVLLFSNIFYPFFIFLFCLYYCIIVAEPAIEAFMQLRAKHEIEEECRRKAENFASQVKDYFNRTGC